MAGAWQRWVPNWSVRDQLLEAMDLDAVDALFSDVPDAVRTDGLDLPDGLSEADVRRRLTALADANDAFDDRPSFLGAGVYVPEVPAAVDAVAARSELLTAYTPYQAEASQGMLQAIYEYQTLICRLAGMDVANASLYDGATAIGEAALMAWRLREGDRFLVPEALHPARRAVVENYLAGTDATLVDVPFDPGTGRLDLAAVEAAAGEGEGAFGAYVECPSFLGAWDTNVTQAKDALSVDGAAGGSGDPLLVVGANPVALAVGRPPADYGADVVVGEGNLLGVPPAFGGPLLGVMATREEFVRQMPGRLIGETQGAKGRRAFCMVLQTREQHIRRRKATSNICTNVGLNAVRAVAYAAVLGERGLNEVARRLGDRARTLAGIVDGIDGFEAPRYAPHWNEFVATSDVPWAEVNADLAAVGLHGPRPVEASILPDDHAALFAVSERHTDDHFDRLADALAKVGGG